MYTFAQLYININCCLISNNKSNTGGFCVKSTIWCYVSCLVLSYNEYQLSYRYFCILFTNLNWKFEFRNYPMSLMRADRMMAPIRWCLSIQYTDTNVSSFNCVVLKKYKALLKRRWTRVKVLITSECIIIDSKSDCVWLAELLHKLALNTQSTPLFQPFLKVVEK